MDEIIIADAKYIIKSVAIVLVVSFIFLFILIKGRQCSNEADAKYAKCIEVCQPLAVQNCPHNEGDLVTCDNRFILVKPVSSK